MEILLIAFILAGIPYFLGPLYIYFLITFGGKPQLTPLNDLEVHPDLKTEKDTFAYRIQENNFLELGKFEVVELSASFTNHCILFYSSDFKILLGCFLVQTQQKTSQLYWEVSLYLEDGKTIHLNNRQYESSPWNPNNLVFSFPEKKDPLSLIEIAIRIGKSKKYGKFKPLALTKKALLEETEKGLVDDFIFYQKKGWFRLNPRSGKFCPTFKGAIVLTFYQLFPFKKLVKKKRNKQSLNLLKEISD